MIALLAAITALLLITLGVGLGLMLAYRQDYYCKNWVYCGPLEAGEERNSEERI